MSGLEQTLVVADGRDSAETSARGLAAWAALFAVLALGAARDASLLWGSPLAVGVDGYYYVLQVTQITKTGRLFFPTRTPLMLYALAGIAGVSGGPVAAVKLAGVLLHALLCAGVAALVRRALRSPWLGVLAATLTAFSGLHLFMVSEFINNLGALTALVWSGYFALRRRQTRSARCAVAAATLFALAVVTHRSALPLTLAALASYLLFRWFAARAERGRFNWYALALAPFAYVVPALLAAQRLVRLPAWLAEGVSARPRSMFTEWFLADGILLLLAAAAALLLLIKRRDSGVDSAGVNLVGAATAFAALVTFNPFLFSPGGVSSSAGRLRVVAYVQAALLVPGVVWLIRRSRPALVPYALAALLPLLLLSAQVREPTGLREEFLARREGLIRGLKSRAHELGAGAVVVAGHGDQFVVTAATGIAAEQQPPEQNAARPVYWLLDYKEPSEPLPGAVAISSEGTSGTILLDDRLLRQYLEGDDEPARRRLLGGNPHLAKFYHLYYSRRAAPRRPAPPSPAP